MKKITILRNVILKDGPGGFHYKKGDVVDVAPALAKSWIDLKWAEPVSKGETPTEAPETTTE